jgi:hypothetical protein
MAYVFPGESADLEVMLADSLHSITVDGVTHRCFYDLRGELGEDAGGAAGQVLQIEVATIKADHFPAIVEGDEVSIAEESGWQQQYIILRVMPSGAMKELLLQKVA